MHLHMHLTFHLPFYICIFASTFRTSYNSIRIIIVFIVANHYIKGGQYQILVIFFTKSLTGSLPHVDTMGVLLPAESYNSKPQVHIQIPLIKLLGVYCLGITYFFPATIASWKWNSLPCFDTVNPEGFKLWLTQHKD